MARIWRRCAEDFEEPRPAGRTLSFPHTRRAPCSLTRPSVQPVGQLGYAPLEPVCRDRGPLVCLAGGVPFPPRPGAFLASLIEGMLRGVEAIWRRRMRPRSASSWPRHQPGRPRPRPACGAFGQLRDRLAAFPRPVCHLTIFPGGQADQRRPTAEQQTAFRKRASSGHGLGSPHAVIAQCS
jgi:hypothetical protein